MDTISIYNVSSNPNSNTTLQDEDKFIHHDIIYTFICSVAIITNIFLIYCLLRFKKMRIRRNIIVLNWSIADLLHMISNIFSFDLLPHFTGLYKFKEYFCGTFEIRAMLHIATIIFVLWLLCDCTFQKCTRKCFILTAIFIWIVILLFIIGSIILCTFGIYVPYSYTSLLLLFVTLLLGVLIYSCVSIKRKIKNVKIDDCKFRFSAAGMYVLCWLPNIACFYLSVILHNYFLYNVSKSVAIIGYMNVVINLFLFSLVDSNYTVCFSQAFRCDDTRFNEKVTYNENSDVEFLYTSLKPPSVRNYPKPEPLSVTTRSALGTPV